MLKFSSLGYTIAVYLIEKKGCICTFPALPDCTGCAAKATNSKMWLAVNHDKVSATIEVDRIANREFTDRARALAMSGAMYRGQQ